MELYFWLILGAILLVSLTILLARPERKQKFSDEQGSLLEGIGSEELSDHDRVNNEFDESEDTYEKEIEEEKEPEVIIAEAKKRWALGFAIFGLVFVMMGGLVLFLFDFAFTAFLGSCMIYVGIMSLVKGISFQISEERVIIMSIIPIIIFLLNFLLLDGLLGVIGQSAWMLLSLERQFGDFVLVYILPYLMWILVPTFSKEIDTTEELKNNKDLPNSLFEGALKFMTFTFLLFLITDLANMPALRQYAKVGFNLSIPILGLTLILNIGATLIWRPKTATLEEEMITEDEEIALGTVGIITEKLEDKEI